MRVSGAVVAVLIAGGLLLDGWLAANGAHWYRTADFLCLHEGARLTAIGADPYDEAVWRPITSTVHPDPFRGSGLSACVARYTHPLWTAVVMLPFGLLPLEAAASLWMALAFGGTILGTRWIWAAAGGSARLAPFFATLVIMSQPFWLLVIGGQINGLLLGFLGLSMWLGAREQDRSSGAALAALILKPQIAGLFVPAVVLRDLLQRRPGALVGAGVASAALLALSVAVRPTWMTGWLDEVTGRRLGYMGQLPSAWGISNDALGSPVWAPLLIAAAIAAVAVIVRGRRLDRTSFAAIALPLSLLAMPHVWSYDFLVLALPWGVALASADRMSGARRAVLIGLTLVVASVLPWIMYALGQARAQETLSALVPFFTALLVAAAVALSPSVPTGERPQVARPPAASAR